MFSKILCFALIGQLLVVGCSDGDSLPADTTLKELGIDDGASKGLSTSKLIKADEAASLSLKTGAELKIPEGALEQETKIGMARPEDRTAGQLVKTVQADYKVASAPYVLTPHGTKFKRDVDVTLPIAKSDGRRIAVAFLEDEKDTSWELYEAIPKVEGKSASVKVAHFSVLVLVELEDSLDAGSIEPRVDAGGLAGELDAQRADARDAASGSSGGGGDAAAAEAGPRDAGANDAATDASAYETQLMTRFASCNMQSSPGTFNVLAEPETARERCEAACKEAASCADFATTWCPTGTPSTPFTTCMERCDGFRRRTCLNDAGVSTQARDCDFAPECSDFSDETDCVEGEDFMWCDTEQRAPLPLVCDHTWDCNGGGDEFNCPNLTYFECGDGERLRVQQRCDVTVDCTNGADETGCSYYLCTASSLQIPLRAVCDLKRDCPSGDDEGPSCLHLGCIDQNQ